MLRGRGGTGDGGLDPIGERPAERGGAGGEGRLPWLLIAARLSLAWDRLWPALLPLVILICLFLTLSLSGLWLVVPAAARIVGSIAFVLVGLAALWPLTKLRWPTHGEALRRVDRAGVLAHRPATASEDRLALGAGSGLSQALWALHKRRAAEAVKALPVPTPRPDAPRHDRYALRAAALVGVVAGLFAAGPEWFARITAVADWQAELPAGPAFRLDGWIDPPVYTRRTPVVLDLTQPAEGGSRQIALKAPARSVIVIRAAGPGSVAATPSGGVTPAPAKDAAPDSSAAATAPAGGGPKTKDFEARFVLGDSGRLAIAVGGRARAQIELSALPDAPPQVAFAKPPEHTGPGAMTLTYRASDDYGIASLEASVTPADEGSLARALVPPPRPPLTLPADPTDKAAETASAMEIGDSPWAGARVNLTLVARDDSGQEATTDKLEVVLPQRPFAHPLAKALVEQRRILATDKATRPKVQTALDALMIEPDLFTPKLGEYLGLSIAADRLRGARGDEDLVDVADFLWQMALRLEDGDLSGAERDLRAAQEALKQALDRGASPDEIKRLTQELKQAMDKFLREFAQKSLRDRQNGQNQPSPRNEAQRTITQQDLNRLLDKLEQMARDGSVADAQRLLEQMKRLLENLQTARPSSPQQNQMGQALNELDEMTRDQQDLRDETFRNQPPEERERMQGPRGQRFGQQGRGLPQSGPRGERGQQGQNQQGEGQQGEAEGEGSGPGRGMGDLRQRQEQLRQRLEAMRRRMQEQGMPGGEGKGGEGKGGIGEALGEAQDAMREAENGLGQGDGEGALGQQGRALEAMRRGADQMAQQMQGQPGEPGDGGEQAGDPNGEGGDRPGSRNAERGQDSSDPLGRPTRSFRAEDNNSRFSRQGGRSGAEIRIDEVIGELRRRLGDPSRPREELDYFDRLLKPR